MRAVGDGAQAIVIDLAGARLTHDELQGCRHHEELVDALVLDQIEHLKRIELASDDRLYALIENANAENRCRRCARSASRRGRYPAKRKP